MALPSLGPAGWTLTHCQPCWLGTHRVARCVSSPDVDVQRRARGAARLHPGEREGLGGPLLGLGKRSSKPTCLETSQRRFPAPNFSEFSCRGVQLPPPPPSPPFSSALLGWGT